MTLLLGSFKRSSRFVEQSCQCHARRLAGVEVKNGNCRRRKPVALGKTPVNKGFQVDDFSCEPQESGNQHYPDALVAAYAMHTSEGLYLFATAKTNRCPGKHCQSTVTKTRL